MASCKGYTTVNNGVQPKNPQNGYHSDGPHSGTNGFLQNNHYTPEDDDLPEPLYEDSETSSTPKKENWDRHMDFILATVGYAVGLGNIWRFPYLCYKNGGGAFFIPYILFLVCGGIPVFFLEMCLGQYTGLGGLPVWKICPLFGGIGYCTTITMFLLNSYYILVMAWAMYYFVLTFTALPSVPWKGCGNYWNTEYCYDPAASVAVGNDTNMTSLINTAGLTLTNVTSEIKISSVQEFWENRILRLSDSLEDSGTVSWEMLLCLFCAWLMCYFCIWKGVKSSGKVVYFTATFPYVVLTILMIRGVTLDGAVDGLIYYLKPDFARLQDYQVWIDAGTQIFYSYGVAFGAVIGLSSYNKYHNNCYRDTLVVCTINSCTSIYGGIVVFSALGFMAKQQNVHVSEVASSGPGLAFLAYPAAIAEMPYPPLWAGLFFFMILLIGVDSQFVCVEGFVTAITDMVPRLRKGKRRELFVAAICFFHFLIGISMITNGGVYVFQIFDYYSCSGVVLLTVAFCECVSIAYCFGGNKFYDKIHDMIGFYPNRWFLICWYGITPAIVLGVLLFTVTQYQPTTYGDYVFPSWADGIGWMMTITASSAIPVVMVYRLLTTKGTMSERIQYLITPQVFGVEEEVEKNKLELKNISLMPPLTGDYAA